MKRAAKVAAAVASLFGLAAVASYMTTGIIWDGGFPSGEFRLKVIDPEGRPVNLRDKDVLRRAAGGVNFAGHVRAALVVTQGVWSRPDPSSRFQPPAGRPRDCLPSLSAVVHKATQHAGLDQPSGDEVLAALRQYRMLTDAELDDLSHEL